MARRSLTPVLAGAALLVAAGGIALLRTAVEEPMAPTPPEPEAAASHPTAAPPRTRAQAASEDHRAAGPLRWLGAGGGSSPELNQVSLEHDLALLAEVLGPGGRLLFAGGAGSRTVQVRDPEPRGEPLVAELGRLLAPRGGRDAHYRRVTLDADGPATASGVLDELSHAIAEGEGPLLLYLAAHGEPADAPDRSLLRLWGGWALGPGDLARILDEAPARRSVPVVVAACYGGGFADLLYRGADPAAGVAAGNRCGLFASTADRPSSGCDPDPDRRNHRGWSVHFLEALRGRTPTGEALAPGQVDFDGDGRVSLLEAHGRTRVASDSFDVPTTTSERWLRAAAPPAGPSLPVRLPVEEAVVAALSERLGVDAEAAGARLAALHAEADALELRIAEARTAADEAWFALVAELLARWPVLDDPWHPDWQGTVAAEGGSIRAFLDEAEVATSFTRADERLAALEARMDELLLSSAPFERLVRASANLAAAGRLRAAGGEAWLTFRRLRACESTTVEALGAGPEPLPAPGSHR